jgi:hypothetical protein
LTHPTLDITPSEPIQSILPSETTIGIY